MNTGKSHINNLLDRYLEGDLSAGETDDLFRLLDEGNFIPEDYLSGEMTVLSPGEVIFRGKSNLHKTYSDIADAQFETLCIAELEGDLSPAQSKEILSALEKDPAKNKVYASFKKIRLEPGTVVYPNKHRLKKLTVTGRLVRISTISLSMAATIAIIIIAFNFLNTSVEDPPQTLIVEQSANIEGPGTEPAKIISNELQAGNSQPVIRTVAREQKKPAGNIIVDEGSLIISEDLIAETPERISMPDPVFLASDSPLTYPEVYPDRLADISLYSPEPYESPSLRETIASNFRERLLGEKNPAGTPIKGYEIAGAGINGINKLLGWEMDLKARKETTGEVNALTFNSRLIKIQTPVNRAEPDEQY